MTNPSDVDLLGHYSVAVIDDLMIYRYLNGEVRRIPPEAPVPVLKAATQRMVPGGAANVVANIAALGCTVHVVGLVGDDANRAALIAGMVGFGRVDCSGLVVSNARRTTQRLRIVCGQQQIVRIDHEDDGMLSAQEEVDCIAAAQAASAKAEVVVISDYGKGVVLRRTAARGARSRIRVWKARTCRCQAKRPVGLSRRHHPDSQPQGAVGRDRTAVRNRRSGVGGGRGGAGVLRRGYSADPSKKGMSFFPVDETPVHLATVAQEVFDVSGAGDTLVAVIAAAMAAKLPLTAAIRIANHGAGVVVSKLGTAVVPHNELAGLLAVETGIDAHHDGQLLTLDEAVALRWTWHAEKLTVGLANGCFDLLHPDNVSLIGQAPEACDRLVVAPLPSDASVRHLKGSTRPIQEEHAGAAVMGGLRGVAVVILFDEDTPLEAIGALQPDVLVKGADHTEGRVVGASIVRERGGQVVLAQLSAGHYTSRLAARAAPAKARSPGMRDIATGR